MKSSATLLRVARLSRCRLLSLLAVAMVGFGLLGCSGSAERRSADRYRRSHGAESTASASPSERAGMEWDDRLLAGNTPRSENASPSEPGMAGRERNADDLSSVAADGERDQLPGPFLMQEAPRPRPIQTAPRPSRSARDILSDLTRKERAKIDDAQSFVELGDNSYNDADYATAIRYYRRALDFDPTLLDVRKRLSLALGILDRRDGGPASVADDLVQRRRARRRMLLDDARRGIEEAHELMDQGEFLAAEKKLVRLQDELALEDNYPEDITEERRQVGVMLKGLSSEKIKNDKKRRLDLEELSRKGAEQVSRKAEEARRQQVKELIGKAADYIRFSEFKKAIDACERILNLEPDHKVARFWLQDSRSQLIDRRLTDLIKIDIENERNWQEQMEIAGLPNNTYFDFPEETIWRGVQERKRKLEVVALDDPPAISKIKNLLNNTEINYFEFNDEPLSEVVKYLRDVIGVNIGIDPELDAESLTVTLTVQRMKAINALNLILEHTGLAYTFREQILFITEKGKATGALDFQIYSIADILNRIRDFAGPTLRLKASDEQDSDSSSIEFSLNDEEQDVQLDPDTLMDLIRESTGGEEVWGEYNTMEYERGLLFVNAPREVHLEIQSVLDNLRKDSDIFVMIEARFIDITDDFLQDVGVDFRALGAVSNFGTPFGNVIHDNRTGGNDLGFVKQGSPDKDTTLVKGQDRWAGRIQHIIDGFSGLISSERLGGGSQGLSGLTLQATWLDPFQLNAIVRAVQEKSDVRQLTAPTITAHNGQRVYVSVITQRAYIADYELVSGGTGFQIIEVADPVVATFQEGVILDVHPVISPDKKYITMDVRPTMATLIGGIISTILISLGSFTNVAFEVPIGIPQVSLQQSFSSVTVPNGGTVLLGGFKSLNEAKYNARLPFLGHIPILNNIFRRKAEFSEKRSLVILITARIINPRALEARRFNEE